MGDIRVAEIVTFVSQWIVKPLARSTIRTVSKGEVTAMALLWVLCNAHTGLIPNGVSVTPQSRCQHPDLTLSGMIARANDVCGKQFSAYDSTSAPSDPQLQLGRVHPTGSSPPAASTRSAEHEKCMHARCVCIRKQPTDTFQSFGLLTPDPTPRTP